jgi:hypothetical protein
MTSINSDQIIFRPDTELDHNFPVPPGLARVRNAELIIDDEIQIGGDEGTGVSGDDTESLDPDKLSAPESAYVVSQTTRLLANGTYVVDVVFEVEDVPGATDAEIRVKLA